MTEPQRFESAVREILDHGKVVAMPEAWKKNLIASANGSLKPSIANALTYFRHDPAWRGVLARDTFALRTVARRKTPWGFSGAWTEQQDTLACEWLAHQGVFVSTDVAAKAIETVATEQAFDSLNEWLDSLVWDRKSRVATWLPDYVGAAENGYSCNVGMRTLIAAIARAKRPGCKVDSVLVLEGRQGVGKSTVGRILGHLWYSDDMSEMGSKDSIMQTAAAWVVELAELDALSRSEQSRIKAFISRSTDRFRPPYGRRIVEVPRRSIFIGTTNNGAYLRDETGARRFWPVQCGDIDLAGLERDRDQLWAEAVHLFNAGEPWWISDETEAEEAAEQQADRYECDPWQALISEWAEGRTSISVAELLTSAIQRPAGQWTQADQNRVARCLRVTGWERFQQRNGKQREWRYRRLSE